MVVAACSTVHQCPDLPSTSAGRRFIYDFTKLGHVRFGVGAVGSAHFRRASLGSTCGDTPLSLLLFAQVKLQP
jgi:hypothetical protein